MRGLVRSAVAVGSALGVAGLCLAGAVPSQAAPKSITIWADAPHAAVLSQLLAKGYKGVKINVVTKDLAAIRAEVDTTPLETAPDIIWGDQSWSGDLAVAKTILPVTLSAARTKQFPKNVLGGYASFGKGYGLPVQVSNVALITNVELVPKQPTTFAELSSMAATLKKSGKGKKGFAIGQGPNSDGYAMYPLFSGLGGYFFGKDADGNWDPSVVGLSDPKFLKNSKQIDEWNAAGLIDSAMTPEAATKAFVNGKAPFWIAGPEDMATLKALTFVYRITALPPIVSGLKPAPLLRVQGFNITKYAYQHGALGMSRKLVTRYLAAVGRQLALAGSVGLIPANIAAEKQVTERRLQAIAQAGVDGVAIPNIAQMQAVWPQYGPAWVMSTSGPGATKAKKAFQVASGAISTAIN
jgi:arabinogalactan oligomer/maltooligosaccharide transport system substrate-binding protein